MIGTAHGDVNSKRLKRIKSLFSISDKLFFLIAMASGATQRINYDNNSDLPRNLHGVYVAYCLFSFSAFYSHLQVVLVILSISPSLSWYLSISLLSIPLYRSFCLVCDFYYFTMYLCTCLWLSSRPLWYFSQGKMLALRNIEATDGTVPYLLNPFLIVNGRKL